jgi:prepilin-type N-terminal cleavage/methylation domain-containing protein
MDQRLEVRSEAGFTLPELMLAIAILGVIMVPIAAGILVGLKTIHDTSNRLASSNDAQFVSTYFPADVQGANTGLVSGIPSCTGTSNRKIQLTSNSGDAGIPSWTVVYWVRSVSGSFELVRSEWRANQTAAPSCTSGAATATKTVARNVAGTSSVTAATITGGFKLTVTEKVTPNEPTAYTFTVRGRMRSA